VPNVSSTDGEGGLLGLSDLVRSFSTGPLALHFHTTPSSGDNDTDRADQE